MSNPNEATSNYFQDSNPKLDEIKKGLEGDSMGNKLDSMKRLIAVCIFNSLSLSMFFQLKKDFLLSLLLRISCLIITFFYEYY